MGRLSILHKAILGFGRDKNISLFVLVPYLPETTQTLYSLALNLSSNPFFDLTDVLFALSASSAKRFCCMGLREETLG